MKKMILLICFLFLIGTLAACARTQDQMQEQTKQNETDPAKENTGLFFFRGDPGAKFAVVNAGGGFAYVGAMRMRSHGLLRGDLGR